METILKLGYEIQTLKNQVANLIRTGKVTKIYADEGLVDVEIEKIVKKRMPFLTMRAGEDKTYWMPSVDEQGAVLSPSGNLANAMFLPALNSDKFPVPEDDEKWTTREWKDGAKESYDKDEHEYKFEVQGGRHIKLNRSEVEAKVPTGTWKVDASEAKLEFGLTEIKLTATDITLTFGATRIVMNAFGITLTGPIVNVVGVLQVGGIPMSVP